MCNHFFYKAVGGPTTFYAVDENGDPNEGCDPNDYSSTEVQYFIKWKGWSHIHNTWESEQSLKDNKVIFRTKMLKTFQIHIFFKIIYNFYR